MSSALASIQLAMFQWTPSEVSAASTGIFSFSQSLV